MIVSLATGVKLSPADPEEAVPVTFAEPAGSCGEVMPTVSEPFASACLGTPCPCGKDTVTTSFALNPMAEYVPVSPAATFTGVQSATGVTVSGPGPESPLVRPLPYSMWAPPVKGAGG